eukprot:Clim_evm16s35 gene=Clim_evmTU16s35
MTEPTTPPPAAAAAAAAAGAAPAGEPLKPEHSLKSERSVGPAPPAFLMGSSRKQSAQMQQMKPSRARQWISRITVVLVVLLLLACAVAIGHAAHIYKLEKIALIVLVIIVFVLCVAFCAFYIAKRVAARREMTQWDEETLHHQSTQEMSTATLSPQMPGSKLRNCPQYTLAASHASQNPMGNQYVYANGRMQFAPTRV